MLANPSSKYVKIGNKEQWFYYYDLTNWDGVFLQFLLRKRMHFGSRGLGAPFLIFDNNDKVNEFQKYLENNKPVIASLQPDYVPNQKKDEYHSAVSLEFLCKAKMIFDKMSKSNFLYGNSR